MTIVASTVPLPAANQVRPSAVESTGGLRIRVVAGRQLGSELTQAWAALQQSDPTVANPFFRPEYTQTIASVRDDVCVAVAALDDEPVGFLPFQRGACSAGGPVGGPLSDYQGAVARPGLAIEPRQWLSGCGLNSWRFDHLIASQQEFAPYRLLEAESPCIDLSCGLPEYLKQRRTASKSEFSQTAQKSRRIEREIGPLRLDVESHDAATLETLVAWKTPQYRHTRVTNIFDYDWVMQVLRRLLEFRGRDFSVYFSRLYVADDLLAVNLGLRTGDVYHSWMTTYNQKYARYAPGRILLLELVKSSPEVGIRVLDLGRGREQFKGSFCNAATPIWEGIVERRPLTRWFRKRWLHAREWVRQSRYRNAIRVPWSWVRPFRDWVKYR